MTTVKTMTSLTKSAQRLLLSLILSTAFLMPLTVLAENVKPVGVSEVNSELDRPPVQREQPPPVQPGLETRPAFDARPALEARPEVHPAAFQPVTEDMPRTTPRPEGGMAPAGGGPGGPRR